MRNADYNSIDAKTGSVNYNGPSEIMPGDHHHMPARTDAYLPGYERGHVQASSLGGINTTANVVPQNADVNHKGYYAMEQGERDALKNNAVIHSDKTAFVSNQPGHRPDAFIVNDDVTYADGHKETIHLSFQNESYANQAAWNDYTASLPGTFDAPNPGDNLRASMSVEAYSSLMEESDQALPSVRDEYTPADFSGAPSSVLDSDSGVGASATAYDGGTAADAGVDTDGTGADADSGAESDPD